VKTASEILNFKFSPGDMKPNANNTLKRINRYESRMDNLKNITRKFGVSLFEFKGKNSIPEVFRKFKNSLKSGNFSLDNFDKREIRTLTYSLDYSENRIASIYGSPDELDLVIEIFEKNWRDSYFYGLIVCYLKNWEKKDKDRLGNFIFKRLKLYKGGRKTLKSLQSNLKFFDYEKGDLELCDTLALKNKSIKEAAQYLELPDNWFNYTYFSKVILSYYEKQKNKLPLFIEDLNEALKKHNQSETYKQVVSKLIIQADEQFADLQEQVKSMAFEFVGDPAIASNWAAFKGASEKEKADIKKAKEILNGWITKQFITVFFEKYINDDRRKNFWLELSPRITAFKVFGPLNIKNRLKQDKRIAEFVDSRFSVTSGKKQVSAFFMHVNNYKFIEFSDPGYAFYAYKQNSINSPSMDRNYHNVESLRDGSLPMLVRRSGYHLYDYSDEGRLSHSDGVMEWERVFLGWMKNRVGINV